jgi:hypothetical protein
MPRVTTKKSSPAGHPTKNCNWCDKPGKLGMMAKAIVPNGEDLWLHDACIVKMMRFKP